MSAIARYFHSKGIEVSGYDRTQTELTKELDNEGISIHYNEDLAAIPKDVDLVVYTPAVPKEHAELVYYQEHGYPTEEEMAEATAQVAEEERIFDEMDAAREAERRSRYRTRDEPPGASAARRAQGPT